MSELEAKSAYQRAGVDIGAQERALAAVKKMARATFTKGVLTDIGSFGGLFRPDLGGLEEPVLVASVDGVGTKLRVAKMAGDYSSVGRDLVNHCVNDILVQGAEPLFFMDYVAAGALNPEEVVQLMAGVIRGCRDNGCALLGGETAEMPGFYQPGDYELVGFIVGLVDRPAILDGSRVQVGDVIVGLPSSGLHTNGYSLARKVFFDDLGLLMEDPVPGLETENSAGDLLLAPHLSYLSAIRPLLGHPALHAMAHITGGGLTDNLPRVLPRKSHARVRVGSWEIPEIFHALQEHGEVEADEMFRVFNMGIGMALVVAADGLAEILRLLRKAKQRACAIGTVQKGGSGVVYDFGANPTGGEEACE
jgi:phosphoribosylformylglycinamidine cyclo-ligase